MKRHLRLDVHTIIVVDFYFTAIFLLLTLEHGMKFLRIKAILATITSFTTLPASISFDIF